MEGMQIPNDVIVFFTQLVPCLLYIWDEIHLCGCFSISMGYNLKARVRNNFVNSGMLQFNISDLNPVELLLEQLNRKVRKKFPTFKKILSNALKESWNGILPETIQKLITRCLV